MYLLATLSPAVGRGVRFEGVDLHVESHATHKLYHSS